MRVLKLDYLLLTIFNSLESSKITTLFSFVRSRTEAVHVAPQTTTKKPRVWLFTLGMPSTAMGEEVIRPIKRPSAQPAPVCPR
jgi:hypothetical protein